MFLPIGDENPRERTPYVNYALLAANVAAFFLFCLPESRAETVYASYAMKPSDLRWPTLFTSMFLHAGFMHLAGNMLFLWIFGDNVEDRLGHAGYAAFYLGCGLAAGLAHVVSTSTPDIPTLGASGAISGVVGAYAVFFPRHRVKMLLWLFYYANILYIPAFWWIGFWFLEQIIMASLGAGPVAYAAHIGGFLAGLGVAFLARAVRSAARPAARVPEEIRESSRSRDTGRRPFITLEEEAGVQFVDDAGDRCAVLRLSDELHDVTRLAQATAGVTGEDPRRVARRIEATRGMIARDIPRAAAERIQRTLRAHGLASMIVGCGRTTLLPPRAPVEALEWDDTFLRFPAGSAVLPVLWTAPFLYLGAWVGRQELIDVFVNRRTAFRVTGTARIAWIDTARRRKVPADLDDLARAILQYRSGAALNPGIHVLAKNGQWGWLNFRDPADYEDYAFWTYHLILSRVPLHRI